MPKTFFCVVEDHQGEISVCSFMCRTKSEEKRAALTMYKNVHHITVDHGKAQRFAQRLCQVPKAVARVG